MIKGRRVLIGVASVVAVGVLAGCALGSAAPAPPVIPSNLPEDATNVVFLHHSTGGKIWDGGVADAVGEQAEKAGLRLNLVERSYPNKPHAWENNPHEYWNLWVAHQGESLFKEQATLEQLTVAYDVIVWKNCFVSSDLVGGDGPGDVTSARKTVANYKLQYAALKDKMRSFPDTKFVVWTLPPRVTAETNADAARWADEFAEWVRAEWDEEGDNIFLWDFRAISAEGGVLKPEFAAGEKDSHPNERLAETSAPMLAQRVIDVVAGRGDSAERTGTPSHATGAR